MNSIVTNKYSVFVGKCRLLGVNCGGAYFNATLPYRDDCFLFIGAISSLFVSLSAFILFNGGEMVFIFWRCKSYSRYDLLHIRTQFLKIKKLNFIGCNMGPKYVKTLTIIPIL